MSPLFSLKISALLCFVFIALLWVLKLLEHSLGISLLEWGIYPGTVSGLLGVAFAPLIHGSFEHLIKNTLPVFVLGTCLIHVYPRSAKPTLLAIYLLSGIGVWLFARDAYHIGASGLSYGMMTFIFTIGVLRRDRLPIALSMIVFFLYGGMIYGVSPKLNYIEPTISYEYHFFGAMTGIIMAFIMQHRDAKLTEKKYDWEDQTDEEDDPIIGDECRQP